jgi:hypothetical protein
MRTRDRTRSRSKHKSKKKDRGKGMKMRKRINGIKASDLAGATETRRDRRSHRKKGIKRLLATQVRDRHGHT